MGGWGSRGEEAERRLCALVVRLSELAETEDGVR